MKLINSYKDFIHNPILEKYTIGKYQRELQKFHKGLNVELHFALTYNTTIITFIQVIDKLTDYKLDEVIMLTIFGIGILTNESKGKIKKLYAYLLDNGLNDDDINNVLNQLKNINSLYDTIFNKKPKSFIDTLEKVYSIIPFLFVVDKIIDNDLLNSEMLSKPIDEFKEYLGEKKYQVLLDRIIHKYQIIIGSNNKFQNKDNIKPLKINDEFKSPQYNEVDVVLGEGKLSDLTDDVKGKVERSKKIPKEMKEKILPLIIKNNISNTIYNNGRVTTLKKPKVKGKSFDGVTLCADKDGFFVACRARSKSYPKLSDIPNHVIKRVASTG